MRHALLLLAILGCAPAAEDDLAVDSNALQVYPSPSVPWHFSILPSSTSGLLPAPDDGPIGAGTNDDYRPNRGHEVYRPAMGPCLAPCSHKLVLFIPGHNSTPVGLTAFLKVAADQGYHVIGIDYPNPVNITQICTTSSTCFGDVRAEVTFANDTSDPIPLQTHPQDAIIKRLKALLLYLEQIDPFGGWGNFLDEDPSFEDGVRPHYASIVVAAHSLGTGYAGYIAKKFAVNRVVLLAGMLDGVDGDPPASAAWIAGHATPSSAYYGLIHIDDTGNDRFARSTNNWSTLGMPASHQRVSWEPCSGTCSPHNSVAQDEATYGGWWRWMLGTP
ncbi:MAG TPA: hypothetical protein VKE22_22360 [Haliangiales bacterium]|nr:hypothetical protein [Haliangiales bacterium]